MGQKSGKWRYSFLFPTFFRKHVWAYQCPSMTIALLSHSSSHWAQTLPPSLHQPCGCDSFPLSPFSWPHCPGMAQSQHPCRICLFYHRWVSWQQRFSPPPPHPHSFGKVRQIFIHSFIHLLTHSYISIVQGTAIDPGVGIKHITQALYVMSSCVSLCHHPLPPRQHLGNSMYVVFLYSHSLPYFIDATYLTLLTLVLCLLLYLFNSYLTFKIHSCNISSRKPSPILWSSSHSLFYDYSQST